MKRVNQTLIMACLIFLQTAMADAQTPTITVLKDMSFSMVITNTTSTIAPTDPGAAEIEVQFPGQGSFGMNSITLNLPAYLTSGGNNLPITFGTNSAAWNTTNSFSGSTTFDPSLGYSRFTGANTPLTLYIWIGGTISPGNGQAAGNYTGAISANASVATFFPFAQYQTNQDIQISATIIQGLSLMSTGTLDFGFIVAGTTPPSLSAQSGTAPEITAAGSGRSRITVTFSSTTTLDDSHGNTLTFTPNVYGSSVSTGQAGAAVVSSGQRVRLSGTNRTTGYYYFWLGGSLNSPPPGQPPGTYMGTFTLTVSY